MPTQPEIARARWIQNDDAFRALVAGGATSSEVAAELGITKNAAIGRADRLELVWARSPIPADTPTKPISLNIWPAPGRCLWPNDLYPGDDGFGFCGEANAPVGAYCAEHRAMAYLPPKKRKLRATAQRA